MLGALDEVGPEPVADAPRARVQHHPDIVGFVEAQLDEVVARAQRAQVAETARVGGLGVLGHDGVVAVLQASPLFSGRRGGLDLPGALVVAPAVVGPAMRHGGLDVRADAEQVVGQVLGADRGAHRHHAAADVDAHGGRDDRPQGGNDRTDRRAHPPVHVGHDRHVLVDEGQGGHVAQLLEGRVLDGHASRPRLDRRAVAFDMCEAAHGLLLFQTAPPGDMVGELPAQNEETPPARPGGAPTNIPSSDEP